MIRVKGPVPAVEVKVNCPVPPEQMVLPAKLPCGKGLIVMVAAAPVKLLLRTHVLASVTDTNVYTVVEVTGVVNTANAVPLVTLDAVRFAVPSLYTTV